MKNPKKVKFSPHMRHLLEYMRALPTKELLRRDGGFWNLQDTKYDAFYGVWEEYWGTETVFALFDRHVITPAPGQGGQPFHNTRFVLSPMWEHP